MNFEWIFFLVSCHAGVSCLLHSDQKLIEPHCIVMPYENYEYNELSGQDFPLKIAPPTPSGGRLQYTLVQKMNLISEYFIII